ncbi:MAG: type II toxin-antitoxin system RelE/ParE family toxin, partial [Gammaproteobacteria bacterium]
ATERDFELIFDHLLESYASFGEGLDEAATHAAQRVIAIRKAAARLATAPLRGAARDDVQSGVRHLTIDRATYWFEVDESARRVRVLAVFFGGQDQLRRMLMRLLSEDRG